MSQLKKGALLTYLKVFLTNIIGLVLTPFIVKNLGDSEYGLYILIGSFVGYLGLMNLGINNAIVRFIAKYRAENDKKKEQEFLGTTMWLYLFISIALTIVGLILYYNLENIFSASLNKEEMEKAKIMFLILVANFAIALPGGSFFAICGGYESFVFPSALSIIKYIIRAISIFCILTLGGKAISIVILDTVLNILIILISGIYVIKKLKVKIPLNVFHKDLTKDIFSYSLWVFIFGIVFQFQWSAGQIILGITTDTITVAIYGIGILLGGYYGAFAGGINGVLIPRATQMVVKNSDGEELTKSMIKIGRLNSYILLLILSGFILFGKNFILLWVGQTYIASWSIALLLMCVLTLPLIQSFGNSILEAKRKNRFKSMVSLVSVSIGLIIGIFLSKQYGIFGIALPIALAMALNSIIMNFYYKKIFQFNILSFFSKVLLAPLLLYGTSVFACYLLLNNFNIDSWFLFITCAACYALIHICITYFILMNQYEKKLIKGLLKIKK